MAVLHLAFLWGTTCLSGTQIIAHAIHHGFTHAFYRAYLPQSLTRVPRKYGRDHRIVSAIAVMHGVVVVSPKGILFSKDFCFS